MAEVKPELSMVLKEATIEYTVQNFSTLKDSITLPPCTIQHLPWNVLVKPFYETDLGKLPFGFFITCDGNDSTNWTCRADVEFNIYPFNKKCRVPYSRRRKHTFSAKANTTGFEILWEKITTSEKRLIDNDSIILEVCINCHPKDNEEANADYSVVETVFRHTIKNISKIQKTFILGPFPALNLSWKIIANFPTIPTEPQSLGLYLQCNKDVYSDTWNCDARIELRLLNHQKSDEKLCRIVQHQFSGRDNTAGVDDFIQWKDLLNVAKGFIKDDSIIVEVYVIPAKFDLQAYLNVREGTFWFKFENISKITGDQLSSPCIIGNFPWKILIKQFKKSDEELYLGCFLEYGQVNPSTSSSCDAIATLSLLSIEKDQKSYTKSELISCIKLYSNIVHEF
ncbi:uncharacterized protein LOC123258813 [Cotesia glomerata]|uniref:uncharacterized protein LOC123258813 n=1 Tax=Cotesia glomerata TaxID=32391 RepID=UPI001D031D6B|nr:uncharacterized protein LOC123258813 [Cotesia glomerata]